MAKGKYYKKKNNSMFSTVVTVVVIVVVMLGLINIFGGGSFFSASQTNVDNEGNPIITLNTDFCQDNPTKTLKVRVKDLLSSTGAYINGSTIYVNDLDTDSTVEYVVDSGTSGTFDSVTTDLKCGSEKGYEIFVKGTGDYSSDGKVVISPEMLRKKVTSTEITIPATLYSAYKVKAYDLDARSSGYSNTDSTDYITSLTSTFYGGTSNTSWAIGTDGELKLELEFAPVSSAETKGKGMLIALDLSDDSNVDDWDLDATELVWDGQTLTPLTDGVNGLSSYELIYEVPNPIGMRDGVKDSSVKAVLSLRSGDGVNPDYDVVMKVVALGDIKSTKTDAILENVGFKDDSSKTELYSAQTVTLSIS